MPFFFKKTCRIWLKFQQDIVKQPQDPNVHTSKGRLGIAALNFSALKIKYKKLFRLLILLKKEMSCEKTRHFEHHFDASSFLRHTLSLSPNARKKAC
jgi:hypothetical protein